MSQSHHSKYYFEDEMSVFLVEDRLFKVHRHFLKRDSPVFQGMFACPPPPDGTEGGSDENPIPLPDVTCQQFEVLLEFFYDRTYEPRTLPLKEQISLLSISTRFDFERIRQQTIDAIGKQNLHPVDLILLAEKYDVVPWLRHAYITLCRRSEPLDVVEAEELGYKKTVLLAKAREKRCQTYPSRWGNVTVSVQDMGVIVDEIFFPPSDNSEANA